MAMAFDTGLTTSATNVISFNVGGHTFTTLRETLLKEAQSRLALLARGAIPVVRDANGSIIVDRDARHFPLVLNWLRDGWCALPSSPQERRELLQEVRYYQMSGFEGWLRTQEVLGDGGGYATAAPGLPDYELTMASPRGTAGPAPWSSHRPPSVAASGGLASPPPPSHTAGSHLGSTLGRGSPAKALVAAQAPLYGSSTGSPGPATWSGRGGGGGGGGGGTLGAEGVAASLREAFLAATAPQRPAPHVAPYSLPTAADDSAASWTSKYLRGNESLRGLVNTLLELAFVAPHRALHGGRSHLSISVTCSHGSEASLVGSKEDQMRSKLLELRVRGSLGWSFELTLRPSSDAVLWDKYGGVAAAVQDNWFVLGAVLRDQFGVVLEEDTAARPACAACRRTCLAVNLNKIY